ncbi:MAG: class I SAM-dependent methyltransferase [Caulobacteraceae bacterium]
MTQIHSSRPVRPAPLRNLASMNRRFAPHLARTLVLEPRERNVAAAFASHAAKARFEFTDDWTAGNLPFSAPLIRRFALGRERIAFLEIGAYEGRNLAFMDWLLPGQIEATVIDPWFDEALNPEAKYHEVEPRFRRNAERLTTPWLRIHKGFSTYELPKMVEAGEAFDLIYVDGSHTAWSVMVDLAFCAALLKVGGMMILDDYWHEESEIGGPGVKPAVDRFHGLFHRYFTIEAVYRQVVLRKVSDIPR